MVYFDIAVAYMFCNILTKLSKGDNSDYSSSKKYVPYALARSTFDAHCWGTTFHRNLFKNIKQIPSLRGDNCMRSKHSVKLQ